MSKAAAKLARDINTIQYASVEALEAERRNQLAKGRNQSLRLIDAIEAELRSRQRGGDAKVRGIPSFI